MPFIHVPRRKQIVRRDWSAVVTAYNSVAFRKTGTPATTYCGNVLGVKPNSADYYSADTSLKNEWSIVASLFFTTTVDYGTIGGICSYPGSNTRDRSLDVRTNKLTAYIYDGDQRNLSVGPNISVGKIYNVAITCTATTLSIAVDGDVKSLAVSNSGYTGYSSTTICLGNAASNAFSGSYAVPLFAFAWQSLDIESLTRLSNDPWQIFTPDRRVIYFPLNSGGGSYTLEAGYGTVAVTGVNASTLASRLLQGGHGAYAISGQDATLFKLLSLALASGSFATVGQAANLKVNRILVGSQGDYQIFGQTLAPIVSRLLAGGAGNYSLDTQPASLVIQRKLTAEHGAYALSGQSIELTYTPAGGYTLTCATGSYSLTTPTAQLLASRLLNGQVGTFTLSGADAALGKAFILTLETGAFQADGTDAQLIASRLLAMAAGGYSVTAFDADLGKQYRVALEVGSVSVSGFDVSTLVERVLSGSVGVYAVVGRSATLDYSGYTAGSAPFLALTFDITPPELTFELQTPTITFYLN